jgi:hypothetical protein
MCVCCVRGKVVGEEKEKEGEEEGRRKRRRERDTNLRLHCNGSIILPLFCICRRQICLCTLLKERKKERKKENKLRDGKILKNYSYLLLLLTAWNCENNKALLFVKCIVILHDLHFKPPAAAVHL